MSTKNKLLLSAVVVGVLGSFAALGVFGLFSATTQNAGNEISTGTVAFSDNDQGSALYNVTGAKPADSVTKCIKATYTGSLASEVRFFSPSTAGPLAQYVDLTITQGTQTTGSFPDCGNFAPDATGAIFTGTLQSFEQTRNTYANGINVDPVGQSTWLTGNSLVFKFQATLQAGTPDASQGSTTGVHTFIWEAQNN